MGTIHKRFSKVIRIFKYNNMVKTRSIRVNRKTNIHKCCLSIICLAIMSIFSTSINAQAIKVEVIENDGKYSVYRDGKPYQVNGVGFIGNDLQGVAINGANSIRTWSVDRNDMPIEDLLDEAHSLGLTVSLTLRFAKERHGFDFNDELAVANLVEKTRGQVLKHKDHPALLLWIVGNEVNINYTNPKVFDALNTVALMIKAIDPYHPVTTALAGFDRKAIADINERAPDIDFISFQMYADLLNLPKHIEALSYTKPYFVTEWGAVGHWEVAKTSWGAPIENTSTEKAQNYLKGFNEVLRTQSHQAIGNYVFLWGQKQERTPTWYGMFLASGEATQVIDVMHKIWKSEARVNTSPRVSPITINGRTASEDVKLNQGEQFRADISIQEPDNDNISVIWEIREETKSVAIGGEYEDLPQLISTNMNAKSLGQAMVVAPKVSGAYRLFAYVYDNKGNAAHANIPFLVK